MSPQYGELRPTSGWDWLTSLGHPCKFQLVSRLGSVTARHLVVGVSQTLWRWTEGTTYIRQGDHHVGHWPTFLVTDGVAWSVHQLVTIVSPAKTAEPIKMPFAVWTRVGPKNHVLHRGPDHPWEGAILRGKGQSITKYKDSLLWAVQKWLNPSRCHLRCKFGRAQGTMY